MDNGQGQSKTVQHQEEQPPISTTLAISSQTCFINGEPPFTATTTYECTASRPIWSLVRLFTDFGGGIQIYDLERKHRRIGPTSTIIADEWDGDALDLDDTALVRLEPGQTFSTSYTLSVVPKADGLRNSDVKNMVKGNTHEVGLRRRRLRWMFEDEMGGEMSEAERREMLRTRDAMEWGVDCKETFKAA
ncbi:MAG: hypothetical protein M1813_006242 [Trichoglossum hirsutum]|jgi:hypothetical protein|nr:MAG: hypothetical protein M1813_006242 [Trichoglossum hirsutum]